MGLFGKSWWVRELDLDSARVFSLIFLFIDQLDLRVESSDIRHID